MIGVDFSGNMIKSSSKIEPNAKYYCEDAVKFAERNKNKLKFDYILGLFAYLGFIDNKNRQRHVHNLMKMLTNEGELILEVRRVTESPKYILKCFIAPIYALYFRDNWEFGNVYGRNADDLKAGWHKSHHFTIRELKRLFRDYEIKIDGSKVYVKQKIN